MKGSTALSLLAGLILLSLVLFVLLAILLLPRPQEWDWEYRDVLAAQQEWDPPYPEGVTLEVIPSDALADVPLRVRVTGLRPGQRVGLRLWTQDQAGRRWELSGLWQANVQGRIDVPATPSLKTSAPLPAGDGVVAAFRPTTPMRYPLFTPPEPYTLHLSVEAEGRVLAQAQALRRHQATDVSCEPVREKGLVGVYCRPSGTGPFPGVLVLGGSEGGVPEAGASWLASHGVAALGLAYFGVDPLPPALVEIPLEYFLQAVDYLEERQAVDPAHILVWGTSRGSEAAFLTAAYHPSVSGVIAVSPSGIVWSGLDFSRGPRSAWTYRGEPLPFLSTPLSLDILRMAFRVPVSLRDEFERGMESAPPEVFIPVERIQGPVLLVAGTDDRLWPSDVFVEQIVGRLEEQDFPYLVETRVVAGAGHAFSLYEEPQPHIVPSLILGGTLEANLRLSREARSALLDFVQTIGR